MKPVERHLLEKMLLPDIKKYMLNLGTKKERKANENINPQEPPVKRVKIMEQYECNICGASFETVQQLKAITFQSIQMKTRKRKMTHQMKLKMMIHSCRKH